MSRKVEPWESKLGTTAFNPLDAEDLQDAIRDGKGEVVLSGRRFLLNYYVRNNERKVYYRPESGRTPCGHLDVQRFLQGI